MLIYFHLILLFFALQSAPRPITPVQTIAPGHLPVIVADARGMFHLVFGHDSTIYYATASGPDIHFGAPVTVATLPNLVAGAKRGPQIAVTDQYVVITVVNRAGNLFAYSLDRKTNKWSTAIPINDVPEVAKEGFQAVAGASDGTFHTAWLDLRGDQKNKIVGATSRDGGRSWSANQVIYRSPDGSVCECCRVSIKAKANDVYILFRNWLGGSRDLYLAHSTDGGLTYEPAQKLGTGTWKLNACPMDGGAVILSATGHPLTTWRRDNTLYICVPGQAEQAVATGRNVTMADGVVGAIMAWDEDGTVWTKFDNKPPIAIGKGQMPSLAVVKQTAVCAFETEGQIRLANTSLSAK